MAQIVKFCNKKEKKTPKNPRNKPIDTVSLAIKVLEKEVKRKDWMKDGKK